MKAISRAFLIALIAAVVPALAQTNTNRARSRFPVPAGVKVIKDLQYGTGSGRALLLDLYLPETSEKPLPLIIWIHGGAWLAGSKDGGSPALQFTAEGYAVAHVGYRLSGEATFPAQINDCKGAIRWLRANAKQHNIS